MVEIYSSTRIYKKGYATILFNGDRIELGVDELRKLEEVLQKREAEAQEMLDQMKKFQYREELQNRI